jgi:5S rRNA maturation endonuclease (ribonuclease M5)
MREINLNSFVYNEQITRDDILNVLIQEDIYSHYIGEPIRQGIRINSPLRDDNVPSFSFYYHKSGNGSLMFFDYATKESGDCIVFVCKLFGIDYKKALFKITYDFNLSIVKITEERKKIIKSKKIITKEQVKIEIKRRSWKKRDANFWKAFGITKNTLIKYNVIPVKYVFFNENSTELAALAYAYLEFKDDLISYKIYQPLSSQYKWINNANYSVHQGYTQLPKNGELLIITKSLKDVMSIRDVMNIPSVGLQSESVMMKQSVMDEYKKRFKKVICLFDNDKAGKSLSIQFTKEYSIPHFFVSELEGVTDFSDLVKKVGKIKAKEEFINKIKKYE